MEREMKKTVFTPIEDLNEITVLINILALKDDTRSRKITNKMIREIERLKYLTKKLNLTIQFFSLYKPFADIYTITNNTQLIKHITDTKESLLKDIHNYITKYKKYTETYQEEMVLEKEYRKKIIKWLITQKMIYEITLCSTCHGENGYKEIEEIEISGKNKSKSKNKSKDKCEFVLFTPAIKNMLKITPASLCESFLSSATQDHFVPIIMMCVEDHFKTHEPYRSIFKNPVLATFLSNYILITFYGEYKDMSRYINIKIEESSIDKLKLEKIWKLFDEIIGDYLKETMPLVSFPISNPAAFVELSTIDQLTRSIISTAKHEEPLILPCRVTYTTDTEEIPQKQRIKMYTVEHYPVLEKDNNLSLDIKSLTNFVFAFNGINHYIVEGDSLLKLLLKLSFENPDEDPDNNNIRRLHWIDVGIGLDDIDDDDAYFNGMVDDLFKPELPSTEPELTSKTYVIHGQMASILYEYYKDVVGTPEKMPCQAEEHDFRPSIIASSFSTTPLRCITKISLELLTFILQKIGVTWLTLFDYTCGAPYNIAEPQYAASNKHVKHLKASAKSTQDEAGLNSLLMGCLDCITCVEEEEEGEEEEEEEGDVEGEEDIRPDHNAQKKSLPKIIRDKYMRAKIQALNEAAESVVKNPGEDLPGHGNEFIMGTAPGDGNEELREKEPGKENEFIMGTAPGDGNEAAESVVKNSKKRSSPEDPSGPAESGGIEKKLNNAMTDNKGGTNTKRRHTRPFISNRLTHRRRRNSKTKKRSVRKRTRKTYATTHGKHKNKSMRRRNK